MKTKTAVLAALTCLIIASAADASDLKFACSSPPVNGAPAALKVAGTVSQKIFHFDTSAVAEINGSANLQLADSKEPDTTYGVQLLDSAKATSISLFFDVSYANGAFQYGSDEFSFGHMVLPADGKFTSVASVETLDGTENPAGLSNLNLSCMGTTSSGADDGFKSFLNSVANGIGNVLACAAFSQGCDNN